MKKSFYLSHIINNNIPLYGGARDIKIQAKTSIQKGDTANSLSITFPSHSGTHLDVPYHFFNVGKKLTEYPASFWVFNYPQCLDVPGADGYLVTYEDVRGKINVNSDLLLIRTGYEKYRTEARYWQKNPGLSQNLARELRLNHPNLRAVGVDVISITSRRHCEEGRQAHREFLGSHYKTDALVLIEDMALKNYSNDISRVIVLPLMIEDADGAPCTVLTE